MEDVNVIKLPQTEDRAPAKKRSRPPKFDPEGEEQRRQKHVKRLSVLGEEDSSVRLLEELVFGAEDELLHRLVELLNPFSLYLLPPLTFDLLCHHEQEDEQPAPLSVEDEDYESGDSEAEDTAGLQAEPSRGAAWVDEDDELEEEVDMKHRYRRDLIRGEAESTMSKQKLQQRMREQFQRSMGGAPSWAQSSVQKKKKKMEEADDEDEDEDEDDDLLRRTGNFVASSDSLPSGVLRMKKCLHANSARLSEDRLTTVQFHPSAQVIMTAGLDQSVSLFQVDGKTNPKIQSIHLDRFPVHRAAFSRDGETVIATSLKNKMFYLYDMMEGRVTPVHSVRGLNEARVKEFSVCPDGGALLLTGTNGYLHLLTLKTKEVVRSMKLNGNVCGVAFSHDGSKVFANSGESSTFRMCVEGESVCVGLMRSSRCVNRFTDDGCVRGTSIAASRNGQYLACGSQSGVVNVYSQEACLNSASPKPLKAVMNLLTSATSLTFNPSSEILAIASRAEDEAVRLVHLPSLTVFSNFPVAKKKIVYRASCLDFSPHSGFFSLANNKGHAPLYRNVRRVFKSLCVFQAKAEQAKAKVCAKAKAKVCVLRLRSVLRLRLSAKVKAKAKVKGSVRLWMNEDQFLELSCGCGPEETSDGQEVSLSCVLSSSSVAMAEAPDLFSEQELTCSICLDLFDEPVSTPCGHNFCQACIGGYWASSPVCTCPLCKHQFDERPRLSVNKVFALIADKYKIAHYGAAGLPVPVRNRTPSVAVTTNAEPGGTNLFLMASGEAVVWCDVCTGVKQPAVSSCLTCTASYCTEHVRPHQTTPFYAKHTLMDPQEALRGRTCSTHNRLLEVYCRTCERCICAICVLEEHRTHKTVSVQTERLSKQKQVARTEQEILNRIKEKEIHVAQLKRKLDGVKSYADGERGELEQLLDEASSSLDRIRSEIVGGIESQLDAVMSKGEGLVSRLEAQLSQLMERRATLEVQAISQDHISFLQSYEEATAPLSEEQEEEVDEEEFSLHFQLGEVKSSLSEVKDKMEDIRMGEVRSRGSRGSCECQQTVGDLMVAESTLSLRGSSASLKKSQWSLKDMKKNKPVSGHKKARVYMEDVTLNPVTAYPFLILSEDRKQVKRGEKLQFYRNSQQRFDVWSCVVAKEGFSSGRHYWEVFVGDSKDWKLGVVSESAQRKGLFDMSPSNGYYAIWWSGSQLRAFTAPPITKVKSPPKLRQVGVFLDVEEGQVSFYNVKSGSEIYSFSGSSEFTGRMFPLLGTGDKEVPLVLMTTQNHLA
ncbi:hypothetical protein L3Q82_013786 [Scortum barcoo]|uniref:Uncharacterized protein n=1 Tax=Scortum barcoo TaxID=214431 RepID=A0ACB8VXE3_9TELE|nr:hypothetical protein L3Q82_013786 [Scortum barcoo]